MVSFASFARLQRIPRLAEEALAVEAERQTSLSTKHKLGLTGNQMQSLWLGTTLT